MEKRKEHIVRNFTKEIVVGWTYTFDDRKREVQNDVFIGRFRHLLYSENLHRCGRMILNWILR